MSSNAFAAGADKATAAIYSLSGPRLTPEEKSFFKETNPFGFILFARNCVDPEQLKTLTATLQDTMGRNCPILIDQEGGRVQRLKPPTWRQYPPMRVFGEIAETDVPRAIENLRFTMMQLAEELIDVGLNVDCVPCMDIITPDTHDVIGDRAFSSDPAIVAQLSQTVCDTMLEMNITPIIKHIPGHGRGKADSHLELPTVTTRRGELAATDFKPFKTISGTGNAPAMWAMAAHIVYSDIDAELPATLSPTVINDVIRGEIGFDGLLLTDDVGMHALKAYGDEARRSELTLAAGCDLTLYCAGVLKDMEKIAKSVPKLSKRALKCLQKAEEFRKLAA